MISENSRLKTKTLDLESEKDSLTKRLGEFESGLADAEDAKQAVETELSQLKHKSQASVAELQRRVEAQAKVTNPPVSSNPYLIKCLSHQTPLSPNQITLPQSNHSLSITSLSLNHISLSP